MPLCHGVISVPGWTWQLLMWCIFQNTVNTTVPWAAWRHLCSWMNLTYIVVVHLSNTEKYFELHGVTPVPGWSWHLLMWCMYKKNVKYNELHVVTSVPGWTWHLLMYCIYQNTVKYNELHSVTSVPGWTWHLLMWCIYQYTVQCTDAYSWHLFDVKGIWLGLSDSNYSIHNV